MKKRLLLCTMAAFALVANVCAQEWKMVVAHTDNTFDTIAVEKVKEVTFFKGNSGTPDPKELGIEFVKIPAGSFLMGSPLEEPQRESGEIQHRVELSKDFYMSK